MPPSEITRYSANPELAPAAPMTSRKVLLVVPLLLLGASLNASCSARVAALDLQQSSTTQHREALQSMHSAESYSMQVAASLAQFQNWGEARIAYQSAVATWWAIRLKTYRTCLARASRLARARVPSRRWQQCVLAVENDTSQRQRVLDSLHLLVSVDEQESQALARAIPEAYTRNAEAREQLRSMCSDSASPSRCEAVYQNWSRAEAALVDSKHVASLRALEPRIRAALASDLAIATRDNTVLSAIAKQLDQIYRSARDSDRYDQNADGA